MNNDLRDLFDVDLSINCSELIVVDFNFVLVCRTRITRRDDAESTRCKLVAVVIVFMSEC